MKSRRNFVNKGDAFIKEYVLSRLNAGEYNYMMRDYGRRSLLRQKSEELGMFSTFDNVAAYFSNPGTPVTVITPRECRFLLWWKQLSADNIEAIWATAGIAELPMQIRSIGAKMLANYYRLATECETIFDFLNRYPFGKDCAESAWYNLLPNKFLAEEGMSRAQYIRVAVLRYYNCKPKAIATKEVSKPVSIY